MASGTTETTTNVSTTEAQRQGGSTEATEWVAVLGEAPLPAALIVEEAQK